MCVPGGPHHLRKFAASYSRAFIIRSPVRERIVFPQDGLYVSLRPLEGLYLRGTTLGIFLCFSSGYPFF